MTENDVNPHINNDPMEKKRNEFIDQPSYMLGLCDHIQFKIVTIMHVCIRVKLNVSTLPNVPYRLPYVCIVAQVLLISSIWHCLHFISHVNI